MSIENSSFNSEKVSKSELFIFSGAKKIEDNKYISSMLMEEGFFKGFYKFRKAVLDRFQDYDSDILEQEYNTAISQIQTFDDWKEYQENKEFLPLLQYQTAADELVCKICANLDNIIRHIDDRFWDMYMPPNHLECRCIVISLEEDEENESDLTNMKLINPHRLFQMNFCKHKYDYVEDEGTYRIVKR